jgi:predicted metal-dependent phosphoesterase TrpH
MTAVRIDLHVHSNASDGTDPPAEVIRRARAAGLDVLALTDHDTQAGLAPARAALASGLTSVPNLTPAPDLTPVPDPTPVPGLTLASGLTLVPGMELSCQLDGRSVHLLCYLFDPADAALAAETERIRDDRTYRAREMVTRLRELGAPVTWAQVARIAGDAVIGRPHIARALAAAGVVPSPADAFTADWIADGGRAFVGRYALGLGRAIGLVRAAGGVPVVAHPRSPGYEIPDEVIVTLADAGLAGIEVFHADHDEAARARLTGLARSLHLISTGGSDDHGSFNDHGLGTQTTPPEEYDRLLALAGTRP